MKWLKRKRGARSSGVRADDDVRAYLADFVSAREGVEAYVEPKTMVTDTTMLLVAADGEWTRRSVPSPQWAGDFAAKHGLPIFDAAVTGYPDRMRQWNRRKSEERKKFEVPDDPRDL